MPPPGSFMRRPADRSSNNKHVATTTITTTTTTTIPAQLTLSTRSLNRRPDVEAPPASPKSRPLRPLDPKHHRASEMLQSNGNNKISAADKTSHAKLHKRGVPSMSSLPGSEAQSSATFLPYGDDVTSPQSLSAVPKIKPYLRKMSVSKEDQGMIDLSKSRRENERLAGLGIQEFAPKTAADVSFAHNKRGQQHGRNTSNGSNNSSGSGNYRGTQAFVHPMAKTPRPYTPPGGISYANSLNEEEANESDDVVEDDFRMGNGFRTRRSMSVSSTPQNIPTPLSQSHTASELALIPNLTRASQSNLSLASNHSDKSSGKKARSRRNTELSQEYIPSPSSRRPSFDKAFSFVGRKSDPTDPQSRDDLIRAARQKFEEKQANKTLRYEKEASRRRELEARRERKRSDATPPLKPALKQPAPEKRRRKSSAAQAGAEDFRAMSYDDYRPAHAASLPTFGTRPGESEKTPRTMRAQTRPDGNWMRFSTWLQTRMLSCGGSRA